MQCPRCGADTPALAQVCGACGASIAPPPTPSPDVTAWGTAPTEFPGAAAATVARPAMTARRATVTGSFGGPLVPGQNFGPRYHIIRLLGVGGMGAVYQGWDAELGEAIAIKVIRPEIAGDPQAAEDVERRFKRELVLARQVTHKNVVRIHDLGEIDGIKYITMPYIHGHDLATILRQAGHLPVPRTLALARQILDGLVAAHDAGVVHRDLKPANIMVTADDQAFIMDFGIARSTAAAATLGLAVGTIEYMAPEQASGRAVDQRVDVYAFGLIVYDMLLGRRPGTGRDSTVSELMQRMQQAPPSLRTVDPGMPEALERIVARCLDPDADARYPTSAALAADVARLDPTGEAAAGVEARAVRRRWLGIPRVATVGIIVGVAAVGAAGGVRYWQLQRRGVAAPAGDAVSLGIVPFRNASGDTTLDALGTSLSEILRSELGESAYLRTIPSDRLRQVMRDLHLAADVELDSATLRRLGEFSNARMIVWGQYLKIGSQIQVLATLQDLRDGGGPPATLKGEAADQSALLGAVEQIAAQIRASVGRSASEVKQLEAASFKPSSKSFAALKAYSEGLDLVRRGNHQEAVKRFTAATEEDPAFALAYSKLGQEYATLGYDSEAERFSRKAVDLADRVPPYERYLIDAARARTRNDTPKAIAAYENLTKVSPSDPTVWFDLGTLHEGAGNLAPAADAFARALQLDPKSIDALLANGRILVRQQKSDAALEYLNRAQTLAITLENQPGLANVLQAMGIAYKQLNKPNDALRYYRESLDIKRRLNQKSGMAASLNEIGQIQQRLGAGAESEASFKEALQIRRDIGDTRGIGTVLINLGALYEDRGRGDEALTALKEALQIQREVGNESLRALCLNSIGHIYFTRGQFDDALTYFEQALQIRERGKVPRDLADSLHNLAETAGKMGQYDKALAQYLRAIELRRGADDARGAAIESYSMGGIFAEQGLYGAAIKARAEALAAFKTLNDRGFWMAEILSGYGTALVEAGRGADAKEPLNEGLALARQLGNRVLIAQTLTAEANRLRYSGDIDGARTQADLAVQEAERASDRHVLLVAQINQARLAAAHTATPALTARFASLGQEADAAGLKALSVECAIGRAELLVRGRQYPAARQELERIVARSENLGLRTAQAEAHHQLGRVFAAQNDAAEARRQFAEAFRLFEEMKKEAGAAIVTRADLRPAYEESDQRRR